MGKSEKFSNRAHAVLSGTINNSVTSLGVDDGSVFPTDGNFRIRIDDEIMIVGARSGNTLSSILRAQEGTAAASHTAAATVNHYLTAEAVILAHQPSIVGAKFIRPSAQSTPVQLIMPWKGSFIAWTVLNDGPGSVQFDVWKDSYASYPPTVADTITASDKPKTTSASKAQGSCTGWTTDFAAGDVIYIVCDSASGVNYATVLLTCVRTA